MKNIFEGCTIRGIVKYRLPSPHRIEDCTIVHRRRSALVSDLPASDGVARSDLFKDVVNVLTEYAVVEGRKKTEGILRGSLKHKAMAKK
jgi:hypothetical protein